MPSIGWSLPSRECGRLCPLQGGATLSQLPTASVLSGVVWLAQPIVQVLTPSGTLDTSYTGPVTVRASSGVLGGTTTVVAVAGVAAFVGLSLTGSGSPTLTFEAPGIGVVSTSITVT